MEQPQWAIKDYETGHDALIDREDPETPSLHAVNPELTLILAEGLPVFGFHWIGTVMIAPVLIFMLVLILLPVFVITGSDVTLTMAIVTLVVSLAFLWGFTFCASTHGPESRHFPSPLFHDARKRWSRSPFFENPSPRSKSKNMDGMGGHPFSSPEQALFSARPARRQTVHASY